MHFQIYLTKSCTLKQLNFFKWPQHYTGWMILIKHSNSWIFSNPKSWINSFSSPRLVSVPSACFQRETLQLSNTKGQWLKNEQTESAEWMDTDRLRLWLSWASGEVVEAAGIFMMWALLEGLEMWRGDETRCSVFRSLTQRPLKSSGSSARCFMSELVAVLLADSFMK